MSKRDPQKLYPHDHLMKGIVWCIPAFLRPNHFTILRMLLTPLVLFLLVKEWYLWGVPLFILTAFTDAIDGSLARIRKQITEWGTFYDPIADKILIGSTVLLILIRYINPWLAILLVAVESFLIIGGWYKRQRGEVGMANAWGKVKMLLQFFGVLFLLIALWLDWDIFVQISEGTLVLAILFAVVSLLTYSL